VSVSVSSICKFDFIVTLHSLAKMSALMIGVSRALQRPGTNKLFAVFVGRRDYRSCQA